MTTRDEIEKWREAHQNPKGQNIYVPEVALATVAPFPSLYASDFLVFLEARGTDPQVLSFVREIAREMEWTYGNWAKAQRDADPAALIDSLLTNATSASGDGVSVDYSQVRRFLTDYARANGIALRTDAPSQPAWLGAIEPLAAVTVPQGTGTGTTAPPAPLTSGLTGADYVDR